MAYTIKVVGVEFEPLFKKLVDYLNGKDLVFVKDVNTYLNPKLLEEFQRLTGLDGLPQIEINGKWYLGFNAEVMKALEELKNNEKGSSDNKKHSFSPSASQVNN